MLSDIPVFPFRKRSACAVAVAETTPGARWVYVKLISMAAESGSELGWQALPTAVLGALSTLGSEFLREWEAQDMRVTLFKLLLLWLVLSLLGIQLAWGVYGSTVTGLYHRPSSGLNVDPVTSCRSGRPEWLHSRWFFLVSSVGNFRK
ncbi:T-cell leukemia translocation-altered gene protein isoform X2 [Petaurus breviceps papuanus]|uniref:T-cell leukemia translocation-altered gene protein isoform X2 n=1 Tax=Petaurus breviceps papuanus TaxID=3040969 RepID=UPI0036DBC092